MDLQIVLDSNSWLVFKLSPALILESHVTEKTSLVGCSNKFIWNTLPFGFFIQRYYFLVSEEAHKYLEKDGSLALFTVSVLSLMELF